MTKENLVTVEVGTSLRQAEKVLKTNKVEKLPVVGKDGKLKGLITFRDIIKLTERPLSNKDGFGRLRVAAAVGAGGDVFARSEALIAAGVDAIVIDTAHAHSKNVQGVFLELKKAYPEIDIIVGNIATAHAARFLLDKGVDAIKVGIGPGSICTTRIVSGVGVPQLTAIMEVYNVLKGSDVPLIADGGIRYTGDITKALAAGASSTMLGSLLAGTEEAPGDTIIYNNTKYKTYRGMGSLEAMQAGSKDRYFQDMEEDVSKLVPEGIVARIPYRGELKESIYQFLGGLRAGMGYCGSISLEELREKAKFYKISPSGRAESHPHSVEIIREAPNYYAR